MTQKYRIVLSILFSVIGLFAFQLGFFTTITRQFGIDPTEVERFYTSTVILHIALAVFLLAMRSQFYIIPSTHKLMHVNVANLLTMYRLSSTPTILYLLILNQDYPLVGVMLVFTSVAFLTDLLDGMISRKTGQTTRIGQYLDSMSDYAVLIVVSIGFVHYGLISQWFLVVVLTRLLVQLFGSAALLVYQGYLKPRASWLGKVAIFTTMTLYAVAILQLFRRFRRISQIVTAALEYTVAGILIISLIEKFYILRQDFQAARRRKALGKLS